MERKGGETYEEDAGDVEHKGDQGVEEQHGEARVDEILVLEVRDFAEEGDDNVEGSAHGGVVVEADEGVHLHALGAQHDLNHDDADSLKDDAADLVDEADEAKVDLAKAGNGDANDNDDDVEKLGEAGLGDAPGPRGKEHGDGRRGLEHLRKGDGEVEVDEVGADEGARVEHADGENGAHVHAAVDGEGAARVEERGGAGEELRGERGEDEVPAGEDDGWRVC